MYSVLILLLWFFYYFTCDEILYSSNQRFSIPRSYYIRL
ncbi:hypothetical protein BAZSYMA_ACONTIG190977_0 [Bathymodiolus azoricus thioautotrophic gill symbiont]|uniref:Uncharacterized protein n=1 Tax=Bathymodiolus azoricus thioautotrophic gill symbiont TaxID=235205 RepID=A0A1H6L817_9GAMM|nr:hypothetical protein BAZSYMA_ACONTIG190977_0 [Bathymodiolus azoricus thioautotrophic gill symbiont]